MGNPNYEREEALQRKMGLMALALREITNYSGCLEQDHPSEQPCRCPVCVARLALSSENEWRYDGNHARRRANSPREAAIYDAWQRYFKGVGTGAPDPKLAQILGFEDGVTARDWLVASTLVQWLATNVGQCILSEAGYHYQPPKPAEPSIEGNPGFNRKPA